VGLNPAQREAVTLDDGPALVLAGAGSGKTRAITHRIAYLIDHRDVRPWRIVAVTFTNKAAAEMRERVERLLGGREFGSWVGTFHAFCLRVLRRDGERIGLRPGFNIYDSSDQLAVVRRVLKDEGAENNAASARPLLYAISRAKTELRSPEDLEKGAFTPDRKFAARVYGLYQDALERANAVDFDDLLVRTLDLFREHPDVREAYAERCEHLLVDEYQDTNRPQYLLIRALSSHHGNVFVVGDEDQSIYRFRGAEIRNILEFEKDHPGARTLRLEQNYRSTATVLDAAGAVVANNVHRKGKKLWTENPRGEKVELYRAQDDRTEAAWVVGRTRALAPDEAYDDIAVLYRTNAQSRQLEELFRRERIPYQLIGSVQFYERKEVKDLLAYVKLAANPSDDVSFRRIVNVPGRGIGGTTMQTVESVARSLGLPLMEAAAHAVEDNLLSTRPAKQMRGFLDLMADLIERASDDPAHALMESVLEATGYPAYLEKTYAGQEADRMDNIRALISAAAEYEEEEENPSLQGFLDRSALVSDADDVGMRPGVTLMTVHCAKGLEFRYVFLVGLEENLFPHARSLESGDDVEEERRLCYVAMTRARERLFLACAGLRRFQGTFMPNPPSRFLQEIPESLMEDVSPPPRELFEDLPAWSGSDSTVSSDSSAARAVRAAAARRAPRSDRPRPEAGRDAVDGYRTGALVQHPKFGTGKILAREGAGRSLKLTIQFREHGRKKILPAYTRLMVQG
jgi:DNA helicase-2/ATP-dependent DNA helicase PcrA